LLHLIAFGAGSAGIILLSWTSLRDRHSHGFYRFFAFESILALLVLNTEDWFRDPLSALQIVSWLLLLTSLVLAVHGFYLLRRVGRPDSSIESTTRLVMVGAYRWIRHPLYSSLLLLTWGALLKRPSVPGVCLALAASAFLVATARVEEKENLTKFGNAYAAYVEKTRMFLPFLF
jgi:protein-S-isoprenylcysteine O-methyltransferase Ste14